MVAETTERLGPNPSLLIPFLGGVVFVTMCQTFFQEAQMGKFHIYMLKDWILHGLSFFMRFNTSIDGISILLWKFLVALNLRWCTSPLSPGMRMRRFREKPPAHVRLLREGCLCACAALALSHRLRVSQKPPSYRREPLNEALSSFVNCFLHSRN